MELSLFRNQLIHHFVDEGLITCAMYTCEKEYIISKGGSGGDGGDDSASRVEIDVPKLFEMTAFLSRLLKLEFIYKPSRGEETMQVNFDRALNRMIEHGILVYSDTNKICVNDAVLDGENKGTRTYLFLCALFWHFIDRYQGRRRPLPLLCSRLTDSR